VEHLASDDRAIVTDMAGKMRFGGTTVPVNVLTTKKPQTGTRIVVVDYIKPSIDSTIATKIMVTAWRNVAEAAIADAWQLELSKAFATGPSRWPALSPKYAAWKSGRRTTWIMKGSQHRNKGLAKALYGSQSYVASAQANLILRTNLVQNVMSAREHVYVRKFGSPMVTIDIDRQFESTPYVWLHEFGYGHIPMRDFVFRARAAVCEIVAGLTVADFVVIDRAIKGDAVVTPEITEVTIAESSTDVTSPKVRSMTTSARIGTGRPAMIKAPATFSWGWLGRWFSKPWWWLVPPSKAYLYLGIYSDLRTIMTQGIDPAKMAVPFMGAWGLGYSGSMIGVPLTKKTARRRFRRKMWRR